MKCLGASFASELTDREVALAHRREVHSIARLPILGCRLKNGISPASGLPPICLAKRFVYQCSQRHLQGGGSGTTASTSLVIDSKAHSEVETSSPEATHSSYDQRKYKP